MGMVIDNDEFERLAHQLADRRGTSVNTALTDLLRRELEREGSATPEDEGVRRAKLMVEQFRKKYALLPPEEQEERSRREEEFMAAISDIQRRVAELPVLDPRPIDEIVYDEDGLPK